METDAQSRPLTPQRIMQMMWSFAIPLALESAVKHGVFDALDAGGRTLEELSRQTGASQRGLKAICNMLIPFEFLSRDDAGKYHLTPESSAFLVHGKPGFHGAIFEHLSKQLLPNWLQLDEVVKTGQPVVAVNKQSDGAEFFAAFVEAIYPLSAAAAGALADHIFTSSGGDASVLDIASGSGVWGIAMAKKSHAVRVTAVDWPKVLDVTRRVAQKHGVGDRFRYVAGDMLEVDFGAGYRLATLGHILHSEGERRSRQLLSRVFAALAPGGTIAIAEFVPDDDRRGPHAPLIFAVNMLVNTGAGDAFTFAEISQWLKEAGYVNVRQLDTPSVSPLILADRPR